MTIFLPAIIMSHALAGSQHIHVLFIGSHRHGGSELAQVMTGMGWWNRRYADVDWSVSYDTLLGVSLAIDPFAIDMCDDAAREQYVSELGPLPANTIVLLDSYESGRHFQCRGQPMGVADYTVPGLALIETSMAASDELAVVVAHAVGHMYGAPDTTNGDIMDYTNLWHAYAYGVVSDVTAAALGRQP